MSNTGVEDTSCAAIGGLPPNLLVPDALHRFVVGQDAAPQRLADAEIDAQLGDVFARKLLLQGRFPSTGGELLEAFDQATQPGDPLRERHFFFLGEGSQIPFTPATSAVGRNLRFLVSIGSFGQEGPDVLMSVFHPDDGDVELMAWDDVNGGFNYYRTVGGTSAWVFAGNSRHALVEPTDGKGPFESHTSGAFLMKELRAPWINWHSPDAPVQQSVFGAGDPLRTHPWFQNLEPGGALTCETAVARPSIRRWVDARFEQLLAGGGTIDQPERVMRQILDTPTVNLISSHTEGQIGASESRVNLPQTFFVDSEALTEMLGLPAPPTFGVSGAQYGAAIQRFDFRVTDGAGFTRQGDTHFAFVVPERAFEDQAVLRKALDIGLVSRRLAACLLMTDFPNPVFSERRARLLQHVPASATVAGGNSSFSQEFADAILAAAAAAGADSPEAEFASLWETGEDGWQAAAGDRLTAYYASVEQRLGTQEGFDSYCELAESRRDRVREMPIFESLLLFPDTNIPAGPRSMRPDGTVAPTRQAPAARRPEDRPAPRERPKIERREERDDVDDRAAPTRREEERAVPKPTKPRTPYPPIQPDSRVEAQTGTLARFDTPARLPEPTEADRDAWSQRVAGLFGQVDDVVQLYNPTLEETPGDAQAVDIVWAAFPAAVLQTATSQEGRWAVADQSRNNQDEYCEWGVERNAGGEITRVTFTTEVPEYFEHLAARDTDRLLDLYHELVGPDVTLAELFDGGQYDPANVRNRSTQGRPAHLMHPANRLVAAIDLVAAATVPREQNGVLVTTKQALAQCAGLGDPFRNSDPQIAATVNSVAREGSEVTLLDPLGLYLDGITTTGMVTPDDTDPATFWTIERGDEQHTLRARFEVPAGLGYSVSDIVLDGRRIEFGAQLADRVRVRISAVVKPANHNVPPRPCGG